MLKHSSTFTLPVFYILLALCLLSCSNSSRKNTLKLAHGLDKNHAVHKAMVIMGDILKEKSGGKLTLQIYANGQLGGEKECVELLQIGSLAMTKVSAATMGNFAEEYTVLGLPYLFRSKEHGYSVLDGDVGKQILVSSEKVWLRGLCFFDAGSRSFYTKEKSINKPSDLKGLKIRVMKSVTAMKMVRLLGGSPAPIPWGELYTALQSGVVDGAENNPPSFFLSHHYEVCKFYSIDEHTSVPDVLMMSKPVWDKLSTEEQGWLQEAANEAAIAERKLWAISEEEALTAVKAAGVTVTYPDKINFSKKTNEMYEELKDNAVLYPIITAIRNEGKK
ncbi:MAG: TRAP transporter substrate-binding protein [Flavobacteriales bacterium]|nr:TRAP transporter substrate-binding protein [Flavobacteriales bacterium]